MTSGSPSEKYENSEVKCRALKKIPRLQTLGLNLPEVEEGNEFTAYFWVARELVNAGLAAYTEDAINPTEWTQIHFKERLNPAGPPSPLLDNFYERAYVSFIQAEDDAERVSNLNRMRARYRDVVESRIGRITRLASSEAVSPTRPLQPEETKLYEALHRFISAWRGEMRELGEE
ncbi:MAG: hypothetical protein NWE89_12680 [Candidatus Bathyarchaeota archaeon]|nr:hypothetical protein [Candidatus Bathyarchaeota archaeon]